MSQIRVARLPGIGKPFYTDTISKPQPSPKDVLVKVAACNFVPNSKNVVSNPDPPEGYKLPEFPCIFGLDASGVVEAVGEHVLNVKVGDRVYVDPFLTCDTCEFCRKGESPYTRLVLSKSSPLGQGFFLLKHADPIGDKQNCTAAALRGYFAIGPNGTETLKRYPIGGLSQYLLSPDANIAIIPQHIDLRLAARFGYLGTSYAGLKKGGISPGKTLLINGVTGTLGYAAVSIALGLGCTKILGIGRDPKKLQHVASLGTNGRVEVTSSEEEEDMGKWVKDRTNGLGVDALYDCLGNGGDADTTMALVRAVKPGGKAILAAGGAKGEINQSYLEAFVHDVAIVGTTWFTPADIDEMIALIGAGVIDLSYVEHKAFKLDQVNEALAFVGDRPGGAVNVVVEPQT